MQVQDARREGKQTLIAAAVCLGLAVLLTWPVVLHPRARLVGHPANDVWNHAWGYAWVADALARGELPRHTDLLAWPSGGALYFIDNFQAVLLAPVTWLLGPALAYNLAMVGGIAFSAWGAWLLARRVSGSTSAAGIAAVIYGASPQLLAQANNGISETVGAGWLPVALWALSRLLERPGPGRALVLALSATAAALTSWYFGLFFGIAAAVLVLWRALRSAPPMGWRSVAPWLGAAAAGAALLCLPPLLAFRDTLEAADALVTRDPAFVTASLTHHNLTDALAFLRPGRTPSPDLYALFGERLLIVVYLGWTGLLLALLGARGGRREERGPWPWIGLFFLIFSLGPYLYAGEDFVRLGGRRLPLPFLPLYEAFPLFSRVSHPFRFAMGVSLAVAVLAACGLARITPARRWVLPLSGLALAEFAYFSPAPLPVPSSDAHIPAAYDALAVDPIPGAVLDLPMSLPGLERAVYLWYQTVHRRPVPWALNEPMPAALLDNRLTATLLRIEAGRADSLPPRLPELDLVIAARLLAAEGLRAIVVHEDLLPEAKRAQAETLLDALFGPPARAPSEHLAVYLLAPAPHLH